MEVTVGGKICPSKEILTVARSARRGLLLEVLSDQGKPYALLLQSKEDGLRAVHKCYAVERGVACRHLRTAINLAEKWLKTSLPREIEVEVRWLTGEEEIACEDLTPLLLKKQGLFRSIRLKKV